MSDDLSKLLQQRRPTPDRPLFGLTVLVVEDSRFASEALRLLCLRSGARIRRADSLAAARRHLAAYRPSAVIVDMGLPDGSGAELLAELDAAQPRVGVLLAASGDPGQEAAALDAGAQGFLAKPISRLASFQQAVLAHLPPDFRIEGPRPLPAGDIAPDRIALRDDLAHVAEVLATSGSDGDTLDYIAQFLSSLAQDAQDRPLGRAATSLAASRASGANPAAAVLALSRLMETRLTGTGPI